jgi:glycosyltransferase involved in cell wall biosynthesis
VIVALDATPLTVSSGGIRRYTEELSRALRTNFVRDEFHLISDQLQPLSVVDRRWWTIGVQRAMLRLRCDVFHGTDFSVPYLPLRPSVLTLHDLSPWKNSEWHHAADRVRVRTPYLIRLGVATMIVTGTQAIRSEAIKHFHVSPERIVTVPIAAGSEFHPGPVLPTRPYFLFVGTLEPRKNVPAAVEAWRRIRQAQDVDLVIAGRRREDGPVIKEEPGLRVLGEVPNENLPSLYSSAIACLYPTEYEGFGLPVLEAMQCGCPVITSLDPAVMEVSGGAAIHVESDGIAHAMEALLNNPAEREHRRELSLRRARDFSWAETARRTYEVYEEAIRRFRGRSR